MRLTARPLPQRSRSQGRLSGTALADLSLDGGESGGKAIGPAVQLWKSTRLCLFSNSEMRYSSVEPGLTRQKRVVRVRFLLDINTIMVHKLKDEKFSISETARLLGIHRGTIRRWIKSGLIPQPISEDMAGARLRYWSKNAFAKVKEYRDKHFGEGRGKRNDLKRKRIGRTK
jgi:hypothetical protein